MTCTEHCLEIGSCPIRWGFKHTIEMLATEDGSLVNNGELNDSFVNDASTIKSVNHLQRMIQICFFQMTSFAWWPFSHEIHWLTIAISYYNILCLLNGLIGRIFRHTHISDQVGYLCTFVYIYVCFCSTNYILPMVCALYQVFKGFPNTPLDLLVFQVRSSTLQRLVFLNAGVVVAKRRCALEIFSNSIPTMEIVGDMGDMGNINGNSEKGGEKLIWPWPCITASRARSTVVTADRADRAPSWPCSWPYTVGRPGWPADRVPGRARLAGPVGRLTVFLAVHGSPTRLDGRPCSWPCTVGRPGWPADRVPGRARLAGPVGRLTVFLAVHGSPTRLDGRPCSWPCTVGRPGWKTCPRQREGVRLEWDERAVSARQNRAVFDEGLNIKCSFNEITKCSGFTI